MADVVNVRKGKTRPSVVKVRKFIDEFPDLYYNGAKIYCKICDKPLMCWGKRDCKYHIKSILHQNKKNNLSPKTDFMRDLLCMVITSNLRLHLLDKQPFHDFWNKYNPDWELPSRRALQNHMPTVRNQIENMIKAVVKDKQLWLCVDKTTDRKKHSILNIVVRVLDPLKRTFPILLGSKRLEKGTGEAITEVVLDTLKKFQISTEQLLMFVSGSAAIMCSLGRSLKDKCAGLLHVMCKVHALHLVAQSIRQCYPEVDALISNTKKIFFKSPKRIREFHRLCPGIPEPPEPILTRGGTWLKAAFYYCQNFEQIKSVILRFKTNEAAAIKGSQKRFEDTSVETDLKTIYNNFKSLSDSIEKYQNTGLSLVESMKIVNDVNSLLSATSDIKYVCVLEKFESVINNDFDFIRLRQICDGACVDSASISKDYFNYACLTSVDVEQSFSKYENIFSSQRTLLTEANVETYVMLQTFCQSYPHYATQQQLSIR